MNTIHLRTHNIDRIFEQLKYHFGGELFKNPDEYQLKFDNENACGVIHGIYLKENVTFLEYDVAFAEDVQLISHTPATNPIYFLYCAKGNLKHSFGTTGKQRTLYQFQTGIFSSNPDLDSVLLFEKDNYVKGSLITMATAGESMENDNQDVLRKMVMNTFMPKENKRYFSYIGSDNLKIADQLQKLDELKHQGIIRNLMVKGMVHTMLAMELQQYKDDVQNQYSKFGTLKRNEMDEIKELSDFIRNYPENQFTIADYSKKSGLSAAKLQEGFKFLHGQTVADYIRSVRLELAEELIKTTTMNISEIVYSIGLTSRSYFSKIFKMKFNCSPKKYKENQLWVNKRA